jgi:hypothetical protein
MLPVFEPTLVLFQPLVRDLALLGGLAVLGMLVVVALVVRGSRRPQRQPTTVSRIHPRLVDEAA